MRTERDIAKHEVKDTSKTSKKENGGSVGAFNANDRSLSMEVMRIASSERAEIRDRAYENVR